MSVKSIPEVNRKRTVAPMTTPTMPIRSGLFFSAIVLALASIQATAAPLSLQCPASYPAERQLLDLRAKGWHAPAMSEQGLLLTEAGLLTGPPEDNGELRGGDLPNDTGRRFNFAGTSDDGEKWVYCDYGNGNGLRLAYRLPVGIKRCETDEPMTHRRLASARIRCQ